MLGTRGFLLRVSPGGYAPSRRHRSQSGASSVETEKRREKKSGAHAMGGPRKVATDGVIGTVCSIVGTRCNG